MSGAEIAHRHCLLGKQSPVSYGQARVEKEACAANVF
jgi:hypothetical protein